jgi:PAS domain S-box-containing protein
MQPDSMIEYHGYHERAAITGRRAHRRRPGAAPEERADTMGDLGKPTHDLNVHKAELELQAEALRRACDELALSRARFKDLYDFAPIAYVTLDGDDRIIEGNLMAATLFGVERDVLVGSPVTRYIRPSCLDLYSREMQALKKSEQPRTFELLMSGTASGTIWTQLKATVARDAQGAAVFRVVVNDITARKRAEEALLESESLYRSIGESIEYGVWVCEPDGRNRYASRSFLDMVGITQEQCSNFGWGEVLHPDDAERTIAEWKECVRTGGNWDIEHRFRGVDGEWHHVLARGVPVRNEQGEITCWAGINLDITDRKRTEEALRSLLAEKDVLMRELAHRTKNNLQVIGSLITLQAAAMTDRTFVEALEDTKDRIRAMALVHENIYRSDNLAALGMKEYARDLLASLLRVHRGKGGAVTPVLEIEDIPIPIDAAVALGLIINELATNSMKHAWPGGNSGKIFLSLRCDGEKIELRYRDDGPGLPVGLDLARCRSLGLKLVRGIAVRQLRGKMEIRRDPVPEFVFRFDGFSHMEGR